MKKEKVFLFSGIAIVFIAFAIAFGGNFSIVGEYSSQQECIFNETYGGECIVELTLPEYRSVSEYSFDLSFDKYAHPEKLGEKTITAFASSPDWYEEGDTEDPTNEESLEHNWVYLYRLPSEWPVEDIDIITIDSFSQNAYALTRHNSADAGVRIYSGYLGIPYPHSSILYCTATKSRDCSIDNYLVRWYTTSTDSEKRFSLYDDITPHVYESDGISIGGSSDTNVPVTQDIFAKGDIYLNQISNIADYANFKNEFVIYSYVRVQEDWKGYVDYRVTLPPTMILSYKKSFFPTDVKYGVVGEGMTKTLIGAQEVDTTTLNLADEIVKHCGRDGTSADTCTFEIKFQSSTPGKMKITAENAMVIVANGEDNERSNNLITGFVSGIKSDPDQAWIIGGSLFVILLVGVMAFVVIRRKRQ